MYTLPKIVSMSWLFRRSDSSTTMTYGWTSNIRDAQAAIKDMVLPEVPEPSPIGDRFTHKGPAMCNLDIGNEHLVSTPSSMLHVTHLQIK